MTDTVVAVRAHAVPDRPPFMLRPGDVVAVGERDDEWPQFVFVTAARGAGWVPSRYLKEDVGGATAIRAYDTTELATEPGGAPTRRPERLAVVSQSGWRRGLGPAQHRRADGGVVNRAVSFLHYRCSGY